MRALSFWVILLAAVGAPAAARAQPDKETFVISAPLSFEQLGYREGLPQSEIRAMAQDPQGFVWLGTQAGLARYDGYQMRVYRPEANDPTSISSGDVTSVAVDGQGRLWIGTSANGVNVYDPKTDRFERLALAPPKSAADRSAEAGGLGVTDVLVDKNVVWCAMTTGGLARYDLTRRAFDYLVAPPLDTGITAMASDGKGTLWLGTAEDGLIRYNPQSGANQRYDAVVGDRTSLSDAHVQALRVDSSGNLWIGTSAGLNRLDRGEGDRFTQFHSVADDPGTLTHDNVHEILEDRAGALWVGTEEGLNRLDRQTGRAVQYRHDPNNPRGLIYPTVWSMMQDRSGVMWIGHIANGVSKFDELRLHFNHYRAAASMSFLAEPDGALWVGTFHGGLYRYDRKNGKGTIYRTLTRATDGSRLSLRQSWITDIVKDRKGILWLATNEQGLIGFDPVAESFTQFVAEEDRGDDSKWVYDIYQAPDGILWLATFGGGLGRFDPNTRAYSAFTAEEHGLSSNHLFRIEPDKAQLNMLWLGTANGGLERFDMVSGNVTHFRADPKNPATLSSDEVTAIYPDGAGTVWVGTFGAGLNRLDVASKKVQRFTQANSGLSNDTVFAIVPDGKGNLWISTNGGGLLSFDPKGQKFLRFSERDGLNSNEFAQGSFLRTASGELLFGGLGGFNAFNPAEIAPDPQPPLVAFTGLRRFNQEERLDRPIWASSGLELSFSDSFEIGFAALSYAAPDQNRFQYQLEGLDDRWIDTTHPFASYTRLPGGDYTFHVRAANRHGVWNTTGASIPIHISPPPWRTWWAYGLYVLAAGLILYAVIRFQKQKVTRLQKENRLASIERDLEITATVQACFLPPSNTIDFGPCRLVGFYRPANECGGDWWWYEHAGGSRHLIVVGDVTGHGVGPAMMTAAVATAFRVLTQSGTTTLEGLLDPLNREVLKFADGRYRMTLTGLEIDHDTGRYITWSAGAPPLLSLSNEGQANVVMARGTPLGTASFHAGQATGILQPGQRLLLYTDGILESTLPNGRQIGLRRFARMLESTRTVAVGQAAQQIVSEADALHGGIVQEDDWTFTLLERRGPQSPL